MLKTLNFYNPYS